MILFYFKIMKTADSSMKCNTCIFCCVSFLNLPTTELQNLSTDEIGYKKDWILFTTL